VKKSFCKGAQEKPDISSAVECKGKERINAELIRLEYKTALEERKDSSDSDTKYPARILKQMGWLRIFNI
jgi:hypothetical protein